jgi:hypothetical protein
MVRGMLTGFYRMTDDTIWQKLCQRIMEEKNPQKLWELVDELNRTLELREQQLRHTGSSPEEPSATETS